MSRFWTLARLEPSVLDRFPEMRRSCHAFRFRALGKSRQYVCAMNEKIPQIAEEIVVTVPTASRSRRYRFSPRRLVAGNEVRRDDAMVEEIR